MPTVTNGDCGLDTMTLMLGLPHSAQARNDLRVELSDYLLARVGKHWIHDIMVVCQELDAEELRLYKSAPSAFVAPSTVALAVGIAQSCPPSWTLQSSQSHSTKKHVTQSVGRPNWTIIALLWLWFVHCPPRSWMNRWLYLGDVAIHPQSRRHRGPQSPSA